VFALDRVAALASKHPEWKNTQLFQTVLSGDKAAIATLTMKAHWPKPSKYLLPQA
jgi:hypothetical protein